MCMRVNIIKIGYFAITIRNKEVEKREEEEERKEKIAKRGGTKFDPARISGHN